MSANRLFVLSIVIGLVAVTAFAARAVVPSVIVATGANSSFTQSKEQAVRESQLGERYGELPANIGGFSPEQIRREYFLGELYGVTPQGYAKQQALREAWLGERYGQTP